jgi:hypothetical protein
MPTPQNIDLERVARLIEALEQDLARARLDEASSRKLKEEIASLKRLLGSPEPKHSGVRERLHSVRQAVDHAAGTVSGEVFRDAGYLQEIARILGIP